MRISLGRGVLTETDRALRGISAVSFINEYKFTVPKPRRCQTLLLSLLKKGDEIFIPNIYPIIVLRRSFVAQD